MDLYVPDGLENECALARTTHLGIGAHHDDLEFMAFHGILECFHSAVKWFGGIICTDGSGSVKSGAYAGVTTVELAKIRIKEQHHAASIGRYSFVAQLGYQSKGLVTKPRGELVADLVAILARMHPLVVYTHNPADKHETHLRVLVGALEALRSLSPENRPQQLLGCEMWRGLEWMSDADKVVMSVGGQDHLASALIGVFDSQIASGKRYDLAIAGRRRANATLLNSHSGDGLTEAAFAMDLTPLIGADTSDLVDFTLNYVDRFREDIRTKLEQALSR